ncbi:MAG TPA: AraC family transcriptional regulator [Feifaniaceae bacterium]|nr:AraC family transcriptional regulator [Feifaniaceae bacterium]
MERIFRGNVLAPTSITELVDFNRERPYTVSIKHFSDMDVSIPHYADSYEIILCDHLDGEAIIDSVHFPFHGYQVFCIPPGCIHSTIVNPCGGTMHVVKISLAELGHFLQLRNIMEYAGAKIVVRSAQDALYMRLIATIESLIAHDDNIFIRLGSILQIFHELSVPGPEDVVEAFDSQYNMDSQIRKLIDWTQKNLSRSITVEEAAAIAGYSKYYFCHWFKRVSGITYNEFLSRMRIANACRLLMEHKSVTEVCRLCGYESTSYFIRKFRSYQRMTPREYTGTVQM